MKILILILIPFLSFGQIKVVSTQLGQSQTFIGGKLQLQDAKDQGFGRWSSTTPSIATINSTSGLVTGVGQGYDLISYSRGSINDTLTIYVSTSDSSGYYFEIDNSESNAGLMELRDCDGITNISTWGGGISPHESATIGGGGLGGAGVFYQTFVYYNVFNKTLTIIFQGIFDGSGNNLSKIIPYNKIKELNGEAIPPSSDGAAIVGFLRKIGF